MRKLATVKKINDIQPIEGADAIEVASVGGWKVVIKKGQFKVGDLAVYCEIDSFLPIDPEFEFLRKSSYRKLPDGTEGFRLKTVKLRGQVSQGLLLPVPLRIPKRFEEGDDLTEVLGITKYEPPIPAQLAGEVAGSFPSFIPKTDEERVQNLPDCIFGENEFIVTEKLDGSSFTAWVDNDGALHVCGRNWELRETPGNTLWKVARNLKLDEKLPKNFAIQGEIIGEGIQKNRYKLKGQHLYVFHMFDTRTSLFLPSQPTQKFCVDNELNHVPVIGNETLSVTEENINKVIDKLLKDAEGKSLLNPQTEREGVVYRRADCDLSRYSFKVISNKFLIKHEQ